MSAFQSLQKFACQYLITFIHSNTLPLTIMYANINLIAHKTKSTMLCKGANLPSGVGFTSTDQCPVLTNTGKS